MIPRQPLVIGNWKMHGGIDSNESLLAALAGGLRGLAVAPNGRVVPGVEVAVCPPFPYLGQVAARLRDTAIGWGAQDASPHEEGARTGEVSAGMLADLRCRFALVGHSERRTGHGEDDAMVARKAERLVAAGVRPVVCVGETLVEREAGRTDVVVARQVDAVASVVATAGAAGVVVAYEPVWAIGTGRSASSEQAQAGPARIRSRLARAGVDAAGVRILYGGSVKPANAAELFAQPDIDGGLIGGASLVADDFIAIVRAAAARAQSETK